MPQAQSLDHYSSYSTWMALSILDLSTSNHLFIDDCLVYWVIYSVQDQLQKDCNQLEKCSCDFGMALNPSKCTSNLVFPWVVITNSPQPIKMCDLNGCHSNQTKLNVDWFFAISQRCFIQLDLKRWDQINMNLKKNPFLYGFAQQ